jgi:hypothetical protein
MNDPLYLHKDEKNALMILRDSHEYLIVQLVSYVSKMLPNCDNQLEEHNSMQVESTELIVVRNKQTKELNPSLKQELAMAISKCQQQLVMIQQNHECIEGALRDYVRVG